jgi:SAM-dependent methyltransferase
MDHDANKTRPCQLERQRDWLIEHWRYLLEKSVLKEYVPHRPRALDVGCGPGLVMESLADIMDVQGIDHDHEMVEACRDRHLPATVAEAERLPYREGSFDIVYCSFLLLWVRDPKRVLDEMFRVSRAWVVCLAEPDYAARVDHPPELEELTSLIVAGTRRSGGDPSMGRKLRSLLAGRGRVEIGTYPGTWSLDRLRAESASEWRWAEEMVGKGMETERMARLRSVWDQALEEGTLFQYNPIFYASVRKPK